MRRDKERLLGIKKAIEKMEKYSSQSYSAFLSDDMNQICVIHCLQVFGEAANTTSMA